MDDSWDTPVLLVFFYTNVKTVATDCRQSVERNKYFLDIMYSKK